jgi:acetyl esterase/lipase
MPYRYPRPSAFSRFVCAAFMLIVTPLTQAPRMPPVPAAELLWPNGAPGAVGTEDADKPSLTAWLPKAEQKPNGMAIIVCPGGGYRNLAMDHEGHQVAAWLNSQGIAAFVLKYRLGPRHRHPAPL